MKVTFSVSKRVRLQPRGERVRVKAGETHEVHDELAPLYVSHGIAQLAELSRPAVFGAEVSANLIDLKREREQRE